MPAGLAGQSKPYGRAQAYIEPALFTGIPTHEITLSPTDRNLCGTSNSNQYCVKLL